MRASVALLLLSVAGVAVRARACAAVHIRAAQLDTMR
jgi:hypothetical protein